MNSRSLKQQRSPTKKARPSINLFKIDFPESPPVKIRLPGDMQSLLDSATQALELHRPAKQVFDVENNPLSSIEEIRPNMSLYISCVSPTTEEDNSPIYKSRVKKEYSATINLPLMVRKSKPSPMKENAKEHQLIAASTKTLKENLRENMISIWANLSPDHKAQLPASLETMAMQSLVFAFEESLISQFIGPSSVIHQTALCIETKQWLVENIKGMKEEMCRVVINGPPQSGKSTLLCLAVNMFFQKLQLTNQLTNYLIVPINWELNQLDIHECQDLYQLVVEATLNSLRTFRMQYIPIIGMLSQWVMSLISIPAFPPLPPTILHFNGFPVDSLTEIGKSIHKAWKDGLEPFVAAVARFPVDIAQTFGFKNAVFVYDHFDCCGCVIRDSHHFSDAKPVDLARSLIQACDNGLYFIASRNDAKFFPLLNVTNEYQLFTTERIIQSENKKELFVPQTKMCINMQMCGGCPGYCAKFLKLVKMVEEAAEKAAVKSSFSRLKSVADESRNDLVRQEFVRLCLLVANISDDTLDEEKMNELLALSEFSVKSR